MNTLFKNKIVRGSMMPLLALFIAAGSYLLMSFGVTAEQGSTTIYWYERKAPNVYEQIPEPPEGCEPDESDEICALGFTTELDETQVNDSMASSTPHVLFKQDNP